MPRILITGSRDWPVNRIHEITQVLGATLLKYISDGFSAEDITIIHGACPKGADAMADWIASYWNLKIERWPANWEAYGRRAGFERNRAMVDSGVDICLAFVYNESKGSTNTVTLCRKAMVPITLTK